MTPCLHAAVVASCLAVGLSLGRVEARPGGAVPPRAASIDAVLKGYLDGDVDIVQRTFTRPGDFQALLKLSEPRVLVRWLGAFDRGKAVLLLALARQAVGVAPHYAGPLLFAGRRYVTTVDAGDLPRPGSDTDFAITWQRAATGLLEAVGNPVVIEEFAGTAGAGPRQAPGPGSIDARLVLARGVAQERRCWAIRPSLNQAGAPASALTKAAGVEVQRDLDGVRQASRAKAAADHVACLKELATRFEAARALDDTRAEARVRGAWTFFQLGESDAALAWIDDVATSGDAELSFWRDLFRGRILDVLERHADAAAAYRAAWGRYPASQSAGVGLALELVRLDRAVEADQIVRAVRAAGAAADDPWTRYFEADRRFVDGWIDRLKAVAR